MGHPILFRRPLTFPGSCLYSPLKGEGTHLRIQGGSPTRKTRASSGISAASLEFQREWLPGPFWSSSAGISYCPQRSRWSVQNPWASAQLKQTTWKCWDVSLQSTRLVGRVHQLRQKQRNLNQMDGRGGPPSMGGSLATMPHPTSGSLRSPFRSPHLALWGRMGMGGSGGGRDHTSNSLRIRASSLYQIDLVLQGGESQAQNAGNFLEIKE